MVVVRHAPDAIGIVPVLGGARLVFLCNQLFNIFGGETILLHRAAHRLPPELPAALLGPELPPETEGSSTTAEQLGRIAEQLAVKNRRARRIWKIAAGVLIAFAAVNLLLILLNFAAFRSFTTEAEITVENQAVPAAEASIQTS